MSTRCYINIEEERYKVENHTHCMPPGIIYPFIYPSKQLCFAFSKKNHLTKLMAAGSLTADIYKKKLRWAISIAKWRHGNLMGGIMRPLTPSTRHTTVIYPIFIASEPGKICKLKTEKHITV